MENPQEVREPLRWSFIVPEGDNELQRLSILIQVFKSIEDPREVAAALQFLKWRFQPLVSRTQLLGE